MKQVCLLSLSFFCLLLYTVPSLSRMFPVLLLSSSHCISFHPFFISFDSCPWLLAVLAELQRFPFAAASWRNWAGMVFGGGEGGEALYQQVQSTSGWYERWSQNWSTTQDRFLRLRHPGPLYWSFLVRKESFRASKTRSGKRSTLYRYSFLEVNKMCQLAEWKRGSKSRMLLQAHSCQSLHWTLTISCRRRSESRG